MDFDFRRNLLVVKNVFKHDIQKAFFHPFKKAAVKRLGLGAHGHVVKKVFTNRPLWVHPSQLAFGHVVFEDSAFEIHFYNAKWQAIFD